MSKSHEPEEGRQLSVLLLTDVFPPGSGGSGWSTFYLGKALQERDHKVIVARPRYGEGAARVSRRVVEYGGLSVEEWLIPQPPEWASRLGLGTALEQLTARKALERSAVRKAMSGEIEVLHAQHAVSAVAASRAARQARSKGRKVISIATIRDYWPLCPVSTRLFMDDKGRSFECRDCHQFTTFQGCTHRRRRLDPRLAAKWLQTWRAAKDLAQCDTVVAVSDYVRGELARSKRIPENKLVTLPNLIDLPSIDKVLAGTWPLNDISLTEPFLLYVGKLDINKGAQKLPEVVEQLVMKIPVVLAGDGPLRGSIEADAKARRLDFRFCDWLDNDSVLLLMARATALIFPSEWQEPLSRVLLEGLGAGAAIVAVNTGGTSDAISHMESGWLANDYGSFVEGIKQVATNPELNNRLREGARARAKGKFAAPVVSARVEALYADLLEGLRS